MKKVFIYCFCIYSYIPDSELSCILNIIVLYIKLFFTHCHNESRKIKVRHELCNHDWCDDDA